jgi:Ca2+-binding RTX toxin-like protein
MRFETHIETLESRRLLSADLENGVLTVLGTSADDRVTIYRTTDDTAVIVNGEEERFKGVQFIAVDVGFGADQVIVSRSITLPTQIKGGRGNDSLSGGSGRDVLLGQGADDYLFGGAHNDVLDGGGEGDDMIGGDGARDIVDYSSRVNDLEVDIAGDDEDDGENDENDSVLLDVEIVLGGAGDDDLAVASGRRTTLVGGAGDDTLTGGSNHNTFDGGSGNDLAFGFGGNDVFWFEDGQGDTIHGGSGDDAADVDNAIDVATGIERNL